MTIAETDEFPADTLRERSDALMGRLITRGISGISPDDFETIYQALESVVVERPSLRSALERCNTVLGNMALENTGAASILRRWPISHEPLRSDAKGLLPVIAAALGL